MSSLEYIFNIVLPIINIIVYSYLLILVCRKSKDESKYHFAIFLVASILWMIVFYLEKQFDDSNLVSLFIHLNFIIAPIVAYTVVLFFIKLLSNTKISIAKYLYLIGLPLFAIIISLNNVFVVHAQRILEYNILWYSFYIGILLIYFIGINFYLLIGNYKKTKKIKRLQVKYIAIGYFLSIVPALVASFGEVFIKESPILVLRITICLVGATIFFPVFTTYAITRYRLFGIKFAVKRFASFIIFVSVFFVFSYITFTIHNLVINKYNFSNSIITIVSALIIVFGIEVIRLINKKLINVLLFSSRIKKKQEIEKKSELYSKKLKATKIAFGELETVIGEIVRDYLYFISVDDVTLIIADGKTQAFECAYPANKKFTIEQDEMIYKYLRSKSDVLIREEIPYILDEDITYKSDLKKIKKDLKKWKYEAVVPIGSGDDILAILFLGSKMNYDSYTAEEIKALKEFGNSAYPLLFNTVLYKQAIDRIT